MDWCGGMKEQRWSSGEWHGEVIEWMVVIFTTLRKIERLETRRWESGETNEGGSGLHPSFTECGPAFILIVTPPCLKHLKAL
jgi:hypothetical protein